MEKRMIRCPRCGTPVEYSPTNAFRPFCSERCQMIDLGAWAEGTYAVPVAPAAEGSPDDEIGAEPETEDDDSSFKH